jgi:hypothetical protein
VAAADIFNVSLNWMPTAKAPDVHTLYCSGGRRRALTVNALASNYMHLH